MPLSINPIVKSAGKLGSGLKASINQATGALNTPGLGFKSSLNDTANRLSGGLGSGLNGISAGFEKGLSNLSSAVQSSIPLGGLGSLSNTVGTISNLAGTASGVIGAIASGGFGGGFSDAAGALSKFAGAAGSISDLIGLARSKNTPKGIPSFESAADVVKVYPVSDGDWRVRINAPLGWGEIVFPVLPTITLGFKSNYTSTELVHTNYPFLAYKNSSPDDISISCEWPVESVTDGEEYLEMLLLGRTLTKMFYGTGQEVGQPPPICSLQGYSLGGASKILPPTPVVVKSFSTDYKDDISYLQVGQDYVPRLSSVNITVTPVYSRTAQRYFDLSAYRQNSSIIRY